MNHSSKLTIGDINDLELSDIPEHDILCAGFPCQPFSIAGKRKGFKDSRSNVFWKMLEIIKHFRPSIIVLENVKNLETHDKGKTFATIISKLKSVGYNIKHKVLNTTEFGIPHHRERIYIVCFLDKTMFKKFSFSIKPVAKRKITEFIQDEIPTKYYYTDRYSVYTTIADAVTKHISTNTLYQYRRYYVRENKSGECPTLTANMGTGGHNVPLLLDDKGIRKLTPTECFRLQGLEYNLPNISDSKLYKLAGNAVSLPVIRSVAKILRDVM